jgi:hypothetical protein
MTQTSIVSQAAAVLAEEVQSLAAGSVSKLSSLVGAGAPTSQAPVEELREQARSLVDTLVRVLGERPDRLAQLVTQATGASEARASGSTATVLLLRSPQPVQAGEVARVPLRVVNDDTEKDECVLVSTDLIGLSGHRIPASHVRVSPTPASIPAEASADVAIEVRVPSGTPAGSYTGLLQTDDGEALRALVIVTVAD